MRRASYLLALVALGCKPPPPKPPPEPIAEAPPPAPKCEALSEACTAKPGTKATIQRTEWSLQPPTGWTYAQEEDASIALSQGSAMVVTIYDIPDAKKKIARRDEVVTAVTMKMGVAQRKKKLSWPAKPGTVMSVGTLKVLLYQFNGARLGLKDGPLLVFSSSLPDGKELLGVAFVPNDDKTNADEAIIKAIMSISPHVDGAAARPSTASSP